MSTIGGLYIGRRRAPAGERRTSDLIRCRGPGLSLGPGCQVSNAVSCQPTNTEPRGPRSGHPPALHRPRRNPQMLGAPVLVYKGLRKLSAGRLRIPGVGWQPGGKGGFKATGARCSCACIVVSRQDGDVRQDKKGGLPRIEMPIEEIIRSIFYHALFNSIRNEILTGLLAPDV
jgi:hypothetical protein